MLVSRRAKLALWIAAALCAALPASAAKAATIGATFATTATACSASATYLTSGSPAGQHAAPSDGVITSFSFRTGSTAPQLRFKVLRRTLGNEFMAVADSAAVPTVPNQVNTFATRLPAAAGDVIGFYLITAGQCLGQPSLTAGWTAHNNSGDLAPGNATGFDFFDNAAFSVSARHEPDADADGFGDETQDQCTTDASTQGPCPPPPPDTAPPETTITEGAPNKTEKAKVTFGFTSSEPGSTFECKLDKKPFKACSSPKTVRRLLEGKHKFKVRAIDAAGNVDASAAKDKFKVVG